MSEIADYTARNIFEELHDSFMAQGCHTDGYGCIGFKAIKYSFACEVYGMGLYMAYP